MSFKLSFCIALSFLAAACAAHREIGERLDPSRTPRHPEVRVTRLPEGINTRDDDFALILGPEQAYSYLTSTRSSGSGRQDLYRTSELLKGSSPAPVTGSAREVAEINTGENEGTATFTPDGLTMIFAAANRDDSRGSSDLYQAELVAGKWSNVRNLAALNTDGWESHPSISADGRTLYFVSNRDGGIGEQDIYVSTRVGENWTAPQNLGPTINTSYHEASPFIAADGKTLYFSTLGRPGLGGFDVFVSHNRGGVWSQPENAGLPINSKKNDLFYNAELGTQHAFLSSDRDSSLGGLDIFLVEPNPFASQGVTVVAGIVRDAQTRKPLGAEVTVTNLRTQDVIARFRSNDETGDYLVVLQPGETYSITAEAEGYLFYSDIYQISNEKDQKLRHDIDLYPTLSGKTRLLVFFDFNSAVLKPESFTELHRAADVMRENPSMLITLGGHTDSIGSDEFNRKLSQDRAESVKSYLVSREKVAAGRIDAAGFGESMPIADNGTEEGRAQNRRVEFVVRRQ